MTRSEYIANATFKMVKHSDGTFVYDSEWSRASEWDRLQYINEQITNYQHDMNPMYNNILRGLKEAQYITQNNIELKKGM